VRPAGTARAFTVALCTNCAEEPTTRLLELLRSAIRRCPHGMLVVTDCLLGELTCATRPSGDGVLMILQPCSIDRTPIGPAMSVGPIGDHGDALTVCDWLAGGAWEEQALPRRFV
jgi:hypothetical protein